MSDKHPNNFPRLHNAMWPGLVGKGSPGAEPTIDLDTMLDLTAAAEVDGIKFDGVDLFLYEPHINIDISDDDLKALADKIAGKGFVVGSVVAPGLVRRARRWATRRSGRTTWTAIRKACRIASGFASWASGPYGVVRIDTACSPADWADGPGRQPGEDRRDHQAGARRSPATTASAWPPRARSAGAGCTRGGRWSTCSSGSASPRPSASRPTWRIRSSTPWARTPPRTASCPTDYDWKDRATLDAALKTLTAALRPWTIDFHVAQNDATVFGSGTHDHTGRHCLATTPTASSTSPTTPASGCATRAGQLTKAIRHICWDGCMFPNDVMHKPETWNNILAAMIAVRDAHGWAE